jgi:hypothetical protein
MVEVVFVVIGAPRRAVEFDVRRGRSTVLIVDMGCASLGRANLARDSADVGSNTVFGTFTAV